MEEETYVTPQWVWNKLYEVEPWAGKGAYDCCPEDRGTYDFLEDNLPRLRIATNPPYSHPLAYKIVRHALNLTAPKRGRVAMLLPHAWDAAKKRAHLFNTPLFKCKYVLTKRIQWDNLDHKATPSSNHAWYVWDWSNDGPNMQMRVI